MGNQKEVILARKRYSAEQIIGHLRQAEILISEGKTIIEAARHRYLRQDLSPPGQRGCPCARLGGPGKASTRSEAA